MHAVVVTQSLPATDPHCFVDRDLPIPEPGPLDLLVEVEAVSVNPIDVKIRKGAGTPDRPLVLGFDCAGIVRAVGSQVTGFAVGDAVWHAGDRTRPGSYAQFTLIDHRVAAHRPTSLAPADAAALPLTSLTAWEALVDHIGLGGDDAFLMIGGAGGVGSMAVQLARTLTTGPVVATASRKESASWCRGMGATATIDHTSDLRPQVDALRVDGFRGVLSAYTAGREAELAGIMKPFGRLVMIDGTDCFDMMAFKPKSLSAVSESMFTRTQFGTDDVAEQGRILAEVARLVDEGRVRTTASHRLTGLTAATVIEATQLVESGRMVGKVVIEV